MNIYPVETQITPLQFSDNKLLVLDQTKLPHTIDWVVCSNYREGIRTIKNMIVRGAPAIGITAAYSFYLGIFEYFNQNILDNRSLRHFSILLKDELDRSRPTAINLMWATTQMLIALEEISFIHSSKDVILHHLLDIAIKIHNDDKTLCQKISSLAVDHIIDFMPKSKVQYNVLTHCNTGALATAGIGTALGVIRILHSLNKLGTVYITETRPYLQGARLTSYELQRDGIPFHLIVDSSAGFLMQQHKIDLVLVGADRITKYGDVANKIGTYSLSVLSKVHHIPFYVIAPESTFDLEKEYGSDILIEEREASEITHWQDTLVTPKETKVINYSFDITPKKNITAIINENGPYEVPKYVKHII